jgi:hypothetical protein
MVKMVSMIPTKTTTTTTARFTSQYTVLRRAFLAMKESFDREKAAIYDFSTNGRVPKNGKFFSFTLLNKQSNSTFRASYSSHHFENQIKN